MPYIFSIYVWFLSKRKPIAFYIGLLIILTLLLAWLIGTLPVIESTSDIFLVVYQAIVLIILVHGFSSYYGLKEIRSSISLSGYKAFERIILIGGILVFFVNAYIVYKSFGLIFAQTVNIQDFKNEGGAADYLTRWVGGSLLFVVRFFSPLGFFALGLHFYYLSKNTGGKAFLFFLIALNVPLQGLHALSRSATTQFLLMYAMYLIYALHTLSFKNKKRIIKLSILVGALFISGLVIITNTRFSEGYSVPEKSLVKNTSLYSALDYGSQWVQNSQKVLTSFSNEKIIAGKSSLPLYYFVRQRLGYFDSSLSEDKIQVLGKKQASKFNGVVASFLYDFGYFFSVVFALMYFFIVRYNAPRKGKVSLFSFLSFSVLIPLPILFFSNNVYSSITLQLAMVYLFVFWLFSKIKFS